MSIRFEVNGDRTTLIATVSGHLRVSGVAALRRHLLECLAEQPEALLIDLSGLEVEQPRALSIFTVVLRQAAKWPGTPIMLCGPTPATRELMVVPVQHRLPLCDDLAAALAHLNGERQTVPSVSEDLLPVAGTTRHARDLATEACLRWDLPGLVAPASVIVTELIGNVVDHAHTMMTLYLSLRPRYLNIAVSDGSPQPPAAPGPVPPEAASGRGLLLVNELADCWGHLPSKDGKVVWAALRRP
ncbi:ATP-binding protein [Actinoplanes sp. NEAU-A12]|uniref:ATP-binding protein n=1 Tax=Actinoplanes sandaracinus TaxID=3045177 RepID=A0ABT6WN79_9ACTN|nr:ATP-binding protein [Actinoplanes sandaracinus]MDI6101178.1 ATP-binding protein [Actinoplanes sandaracinus]